MSAKGLKKKDDAGHTTGAFAFYVYCISETTAARNIAVESLPLSLEEDSAIELVEADRLSAVISRVPLTEYAEERLSEHLSDPAWMAIRAMRHEHVVEHFAKRTSVVPLRFGTVYLEREGIEAMLSKKHDELMSIIQRLRGREEWGVNVYVDRTAVANSITSVSPRLKELSEQAEQAAPGQSYLIRKKIDTLRVDEARAEVKRLIDETESTLGLHGDEVRRLRMLKVESTEHGELTAKFAVLIQRSEFPQFRASVEAFATDKKAAGLRLELTGPWPAYNFMNVDTQDTE